MGAGLRDEVDEQMAQRTILPASAIISAVEVTVNCARNKACPGGMGVFSVWS
ncbi:hypothetical protein [Tahibacter caeni]|uniref:hypothetical protein n=1 Tax=Tahibacter caeni TaxID=1453545 RepID=UPI0021485EA9|nr:hypothetical protein [Tahibacter caeni]